ncbi:unnamed protein product [Durusdinium trenchii]|uniref:Thioredoxin domain-containing protein n=2 Tax=Durusdinium trenchii TaxID=1381693 RepID=A0ABP0J0Z2_9DINO
MVHETLIQHGFELAHSPMVTDAVSFISAGSAMRALRETGHSITHWLGDHFHFTDPTDRGAVSTPDAPGAVAPNEAPHVKAALDTEATPSADAGAGRMVEFFAQSCPHCRHLDPIWNDARHRWASTRPEETVSWQQKECYGANWAEGKDHDECMKEGIHSFPTVRFYSQSGDSVVDFTDERTPDKLIGFAAQQAAQPHAAGARGARIAPLEETRRHPGEDAAAALAEATPLKVVEYVAKSCPHCKSMEPIWNELKAATQQKDIIWEQKECFGEGWTPGKDLEECKRSDIQGFPTLKLFSSPTAAGEEFQGARSASSILKWVEQHAPQPTGVVADRALQAVQACVGPQLWMASSLCGPVLPPQSKASFL